jgi:hypothetical protein
MIETLILFVFGAGLAVSASKIRRRVGRARRRESET